MELNSVARHTSQIRMSLKLSKIWAGLMWAFCVPLNMLAVFLTLDSENIEWWTRRGNPLIVDLLTSDWP